ncbi:AspC protein [Candidatus Pantoea carbekii]|uniref:Aminotransferase n=1 Tax=Candidatus Pantoea carbekii TaxID=1235990 RepID=U3U6T6_9GAMM|nr:AspC protein [Candidatus Pantoea carbekii]
MFELISDALSDPILGLADLYYTDKRKNKVNLGIGVYKDETGKTPILDSVKQAELYLLENESTKNYLNIEGLSNFANFTQEMIFGKNSTLITSGRTRTAQMPGGTGALRIAADFLANQVNVKRIWISDPSWPNHKNVFDSAGLEVCSYQYYDKNHYRLDFENMFKSLQKVQSGNVVLFHACCHNPTGADPTVEQWMQLAKLSEKNGWLPLFDFAYQGFARDLKKDAEGIRIFGDTNPELIVASSYSKNFGLYNERVGALTLVAPNSKVATTVFSQVKYHIRANYSNPPSHGAAVVTIILGNNALRNIWEKELKNMRERIQRMRYLFVNTLLRKGVKKDFSFIINQNGMFSFSGFSEYQVLQLREKFGIYIVDSGRINMAGMTSNNMSTLCEAIIAVL